MKTYEIFLGTIKHIDEEGWHYFTDPCCETGLEFGMYCFTPRGLLNPFCLPFIIEDIDRAGGRFKINHKDIRELYPKFILGKTGIYKILKKSD